MPLQEYTLEGKQTETQDIVISTDKQALHDLCKTQGLDDTDSKKLIDRYTKRPLHKDYKPEQNQNQEIIYNFLQIKTDLGQKFFDNLLYNPSYNVPYSQVKALAAELTTLAQNYHYSDEELASLLGAMGNSNANNSKTDHITTFLKSQRLDIEDLAITQHPVIDKTLLGAIHQGIHTEVSALIGKNAMFNPDLIYDIARSVTNWHIENVNKTADKKNKTAFQTALEESPFTTNKPLVALFNACNTTPSTGASTFSLSPSDLTDHTKITRFLAELGKGGTPLLVPDTNPKPHFTTLQPQTQTLIQNVQTTYDSLSGPTTLEKIQGFGDTLRSWSQQYAPMIKEAFATIKTLFEEFGLSDLFADRTKEDSLFGKIMLAIDKQASRIGTEQMIIINNLCSVIPLDNTNTLDTQYVNSELVKIFFNNKILNPNAATMLMKGLSTTRKQKLFNNLQMHFPALYDAEAGVTPDAVDLMVWNMLHQSDTTTSDEKFQDYFRNKNQGTEAHDIFEDFFSTKSAEWADKDFGDGSTGTSPNEVYARSMITCMVANDSAAEAVRASRLGEKAKNLSQGQEQWIQGVTMTPSTDGSKVDISAHDKPLLYSTDGGKTYKPLEASNSVISIDTTSLAKPATLMLAQPDTTDALKPHSTFVKTVDLLLKGSNNNDIGSTVNATTNKVTLTNLIVSKSYTYRTKYPGEPISSSIPFIPEGTTFDITPLAGKPFELVELQETGALASKTVYKKT